MARAMDSSEINREAGESFRMPQPGEETTHMEGYTNLSLIKEEDFKKVGMGHMQQAKNSSRRVYVQ